MLIQRSMQYSPVLSAYFTDEEARLGVGKHSAQEHTVRTWQRGLRPGRLVSESLSLTGKDSAP